jgi:hypothetical protein
MLLKTDVVDISMLGSQDLLRMPANQPVCQAGDILIVEERVPSVKVLDKMEWVRDYAVECSVFRDRYIKAPKEIVKVLEGK